MLLSAECVSEQLSKSYGEDSLRFTCMNGHNFFLAVSSLRQTFDRLAPFKGHEIPSELLASCKWCNKCAKYYGKVRSLSSRNLCDVTDGLHQKRIALRCRRSGHEFTISYAKKLEQIVCLQCRLAERDLLRERLKREEDARNAQLRLEEEKMYTEAKLLMQKELLSNASAATSASSLGGLNGTYNLSSTSSNDFLRSLEQTIKLRAATLAKEFLGGLSQTERADDKLSFKKVFLTMKFNETPDNVLVEGMKLQGNCDEIRKYFRNLAKLLHPDKNGHPLAKTVFQKLANATDLALTSMSTAFELNTRMSARTDPPSTFFTAPGAATF